MAFNDVLTAATAQIKTAHDADTQKLQAFVDKTGIMLPYDWSGPKGTALNLTGYVETFRDDFDVDSVMNDAGVPAGGKWYSPSRSDFDPGSSGAGFRREQVTVANGQCRLRCERITPPSSTNDWGVWKTGHMQTMNRQGQGFSQKMGYFEARIKLPQQTVPFGWVAKTGAPMATQKPADSHGQRGAWPGFWLLSANEYPPFYDTNHLIEMDQMECYGGDQNVHSSMHLKPRRIPQPNDPPSRQTNSELTDMKFIQWDGNFHDYGALLEEDYMTMFFDGKSMTRYPMNDYLRIPLYVNISLALFKNSMPYVNSAFDMYVEHVRVLAKGT